MKVFVLLLAVMHSVALSGCDDAAQPRQRARSADRQSPSAMPPRSRQLAVPGREASPGTDASAKARALFDEVKRLNAACVAAGGGVSGSPDCDLATGREDELEGLGYRIDYRNGEALVKSPAPSGAGNEEKSAP